MASTNHYKILFNKNNYKYVISVITIMILILIIIDAAYGDSHINSDINYYMVSAHDEQELYKIDKSKENLNRYHKRLAPKDALNSINPKQFLIRKNRDIHYANKLNGNKWKNILDSYDIITFLGFLMSIILLSMSFVGNEMASFYDDIDKTKSKLFGSPTHSLLKAIRYNIDKICVNKVLYHYVYLVLPIIIAVSSGSLNSLNDGNYINMALLILMNGSAGIFSFIQFFKIYHSYVYDLNSGTNIIDIHNKRIVNGIYNYVKDK